MRKPIALLLLGLLALTFAAACSSDDEATPEAATATEAAVTEAPPATPETATAAPTEAAAGSVTVRDLLGREITLEAPPEKIVTLSPSAIEILYAIGAEAIGRSTTAEHPAGVEALEDIGFSYAPSMELVLALRPDLVVADASGQGHLLEAIVGPLGDVPVVFVGAQGYDDVATSLSLLGELLGREAEAEAAVAEMDAAKTEAAAAAEGQTPPQVLILTGAPDDFFVALPDSWPGSMVEILGGVNVAAGQPAAGPFPGYTQLSLEAILQAEPDVILAITAGPPGVTIAQGILGETAYANLPAVANGRVHEIDIEVYLQAPGPRAADGLRELAALLYPPAR